MKHLSLSLALVLFGASVVHAAVISSGIVNIPIPTDFDGVYIDIDTGATSSSPIAGWDINPFFGGSEIATNNSFQAVRIGTGNLDAILNVARNSVVDGATPFYSTGFGGSDSHLGVAPTQFQTSQVGYVGFQFITNAVPGPALGPFFGWMEVRFTPNTPGGVIQQWAFDNTGAGIVVPEPSTYAVLAGVATLGLVVLRRRRK